MVERLVANEKVEGSNPFARSKIMEDLSKKKCVACDGSIPPFDTSEIHKYLKKVDDWDVKSNDDKSYYLIKNHYNGAGKGVRTLDLLVGNETLYH